MTALVGNAIGAKDTAEASNIAMQGIGFAIVASALLIMIALFLGPHLLAFISTEGAYRDAGTAYFTSCFSVFPALSSDMG